MVRILIVPNAENWSAIECAAHCGHQGFRQPRRTQECADQSHVVQNCVGPLDLSCLASRCRMKKNTAKPVLAFEGWFERLGCLSDFFNKKDLRSCVLNFLNEETKGVFQSNTHTLETTQASTKKVKGKALTFDVESLVNGMAGAKKSAKAKTKIPRPVL
jgi:hypothetical protein